MRKGRFTEEQIIAIIREYEAGAKVGELCRRHGVSSTTLYKWKTKFGGMTVPEARRLRILEDENRRLKHLLAEAMLDIETPKAARGAEGPAGKKMVGPAAKRAAVTTARTEHGLSERRACRLVGMSRMAARRGPRRREDGRLRERLTALAGERRRFGYRRLHALLRREGWKVNHKRIERLYREERPRVKPGGHAGARRNGCRWNRGRASGARSWRTSAGRSTSWRTRWPAGASSAPRT